MSRLFLFTIAAYWLCAGVANAAQPTEALVTWHLHTANGEEYSKDLKKRLWPAKGGWTGLLTTAPVKVTLKKQASRRIRRRRNPGVARPLKRP